MTLANAHALFRGLKSEPSYLANLTVKDEARQRLLAARQSVRAALRAAVDEIPTRDDYYQESYARKVTKRNRQAIQIKFMTQGSFAYGTLNAPAQLPAQEIDLDDGMYIPVHYLDNGEPALTAKGLFVFVEAALQPLCARNGWHLVEKECCVRVKLWAGAHIDLPIYSVPLERFEQLRETLAKSNMVADSMYAARAGKMYRLPSDQIMLAHRTGEWKQSDPQQLHDWVEGRTERYGPVYKRLCRFFKGWRDFTWEKSGLSSIVLMCAVDLALRQLNGSPTESRDDELVMEVAKRLPSIFENDIFNPVLDHLLLNDWSDNERKVFVDAAVRLRDDMVAALERIGDAARVVERLQERFGLRIPSRPDSVKIASTIAAIQTAAPSRVAAPRVISSTSG